MRCNSRIKCVVDITSRIQTAAVESAAGAGESLYTMSQKHCELSVAELKQFDGSGPSGKLYVAVNGKVFDVTDKGSQFYGKGASAHWVSVEITHSHCGMFRLIFKILSSTRYLSVHTDSILRHLCYDTTVRHLKQNYTGCWSNVRIWYKRKIADVFAVRR